MSINYYEGIVLQDLNSRGFDLIKTNGGGFPDFKVIEFIKKKSFFVEVKSIGSVISKNQKMMFDKLLEDFNIYIATVGGGVIEYRDYKKDTIWLKSKYGIRGNIIKKNINCKFCNHNWNTSSTRIWVTCPNCRLNVKRDSKEAIKNFMGLK